MFDEHDFKPAAQPLVDDDDYCMEYGVRPLNPEGSSMSHSMRELSVQFEKQVLEALGGNEVESPLPTSLAHVSTPLISVDSTPSQSSQAISQPQQPVPRRQRHSPHFIKIHSLVDALLSDDEPGCNSPTPSTSANAMSFLPSKDVVQHLQSSCSNSNSALISASEDEYNSSIRRITHHRVSKDGRYNVYKERLGKQDLVLKSIRFRTAFVKQKSPGKGPRLSLFHLADFSSVKLATWHRWHFFGIGFEGLTRGPGGWKVEGWLEYVDLLFLPLY